MSVTPRTFPAFSVHRKLPKPFGFRPTPNPAVLEKSRLNSSKPKPTSENQQKALYTSALKLANESFSQAIMTGIVIQFFMGNSLQIFTIMMLIMFITKPITAMLGVQKTFGKYTRSNVNVTTPITLFIVYNLLSLGIALYKAYKMNLVPTEWLYSDVYAISLGD